ncbi:predicted protein, partial [Naegleria gruberi]
GQFDSSSTVHQQLTSSIPFNLPASLSKTGSLTAKAALSLNSTLISFRVETETALSLQLKNNPQISARLTSLPFLAIDSVHSENTGVIVAAVVVPIVSVAVIGSGVAVLITTIVIMMKKKASASLAKDLIMAGATDVELA